MIRPVVAIALGAIAGALSRYYVESAITSVASTAIPYGTLLVNVTGCLLMGLLATLALGQVINLHPDLRLLLLTGFLGSYTTFSSYELEIAKLLDQRQWTADLIYWIGSPILGLLSLQIGILIAEGMVRHWEARLAAQPKKTPTQVRSKESAPRDRPS
ncbi:fluoride efflux transporter CrcB [Trichothermofontia sp.]